MNEVTITQPDDMKGELKKANLTEAIISSKQEQWLAINTQITDKAQYDTVDRFRKDVKGLRLAGEKIFEHEIAERHRAHKEAIAKKKEVLEPIITMEEQAKARIFEYEEGQRQIAIKKEEERRAELNARNNACLEMGFMLRDGVWTLEGTSVDAEEILKADHAKWTALKGSMAVVAGEVADRKEKERLAALEIERKEKEQQERELELQRKEKEAAEKLAVIRRAELVALGANEEEIEWALRSHPLAFSDAEWPHVVMDVTNTINGRLEQEARDAEEKKRQELIESRIKALKEAGWELCEPEERQAIGLMVTNGNTTHWDELLIDSIVSSHEVHFQALVEKGQAELARRKQVAEDAIRQQERERIAKEAEAKAQAEKEAAALRVAQHGDKELLRQSMVLLQNAGSGIAVLTASAQSEAGKKQLEDATNKLRNLYAQVKDLHETL